MLKRNNSLFRFVEAGAVGWFLIQAVRFLFAGVFARASGAEIAARFYGTSVPPGVASADVVTVEVAAVVAGALAPLAGLILERWALGPTAAVVVAAVAHVTMINEDPTAQIVSAAVVLGAGGIYLALAARRLAEFLPSGLVIGLTVDQVIRALGDTRDLSLDTDFLPVQTVISLLILGAAALAWLGREAPAPEAREGTVGVWGGVALGALLFLELALLALPNAAAHWSNTSYATLLPWMVGATALPLLPAVRGLARRFIELFDGRFRGWVWFLLIGLCLVTGTRLGGPLAAAGMVVGALLGTLALWWVVAPARRPDGGRANLAGVGVVIGWTTFALLGVGNLCTFVYGATTSPLVAAFRGLGWVIFLAAALLGCLPIILARARIPWRGGRALVSLGMGAFGVAVVAVAVTASQPAVAQSVQGVPQMRIGTYNIHNGYTVLYEPELEEVAHIIEETSVDVVLLQEVDAGRLTSNGVDQAWWLARRLRMEMAFYPTNEAVYGLAVLSRVRIIDSDGSPLTSQGEQTGVQRVQVCTVPLEHTPSGASACPPDRTIDVYNTWLGRPERDVAPQEMDQWTQLEEVLRWAGVNMVGQDKPWLAVGGTFNAAPDSPLYDQMVTYEYVDPFPYLNLPASQPTATCGRECEWRSDYVWLRNLMPQVAAVIDADASDHRLAVVEVRLERPAPDED
jgi:endonuclease/exonuclease/phosphatase family metal-dependent hydrolase